MAAARTPAERPETDLQSPLGALRTLPGSVVAGPAVPKAAEAGSVVVLRDRRGPLGGGVVVVGGGEGEADGGVVVERVVGGGTWTVAVHRRPCLRDRRNPAVVVAVVHRDPVPAVLRPVQGASACL